MLIAFREADPEAHRRDVAPLLPLIEELRAHAVAGDLSAFIRCLRRIDSRLDCEVEVSDQLWTISYSDPRARPMALWLTEQLPHRPKVVVGKQRRPHEAALRRARALGVDLEHCRVRVGFSRGHLLRIYVLVPLDVSASLEQIEDAVEAYLVAVLGDATFDEWVECMAVDRIGRVRGLLTVADSAKRAQDFELRETCTLVDRGIEALSAGLVESMLEDGETAADWCALRVESSAEHFASARADRVFAATRCPEALKACLEGLPFSSRRFTRGDEIFAYLRWQAVPGRDRATERSSVEAAIHAHFSVPGRSRALAVCGSGFGPQSEYLDLWLVPTNETFRSLAHIVAPLTRKPQLRFYDSEWAEERLDLSHAIATRAP